MVIILVEQGALGEAHGIKDAARVPATERQEPVRGCTTYGFRKWGEGQRSPVLAGALECTLEPKEAAWLGLRLRLLEIHPPLCLHKAKENQFHREQHTFIARH